ILYWGTSEWSADQIAAAVRVARAMGWAEPISNQPQYSALWRRIERRVLPVCVEYGMGTVVWSPLAQGILTAKYPTASAPPPGSRAAGPAGEMMEDYFTQKILDAVQRTKELAKAAGCTPAQLALAWCLRLPAISAVIVGATRPEHVDDNAKAAEIALDPSILEQYDVILRGVAIEAPYLG
ncbi:MAG: aldo/keto reductase, partial [Polyangiaceae bacterium]